MISVAARECMVVLLGSLVAWIGSLVMANANQDFADLAGGILLPIGVCLLRAAFVKPPAPEVSAIRRAAYQLCLGLALVLLLLFEMAFGLSVGADDIPVAAWLVVASFAAGYVLMYCLAHHLGFYIGASRHGEIGGIAADFTAWPPNGHSDEPGAPLDAAGRSAGR